MWVGTDENQTANAIICIVDNWQFDSEIKILIGCTEEEIARIYARHNKYDSMKGIILKR